MNTEIRPGEPGDLEGMQAVDSYFNDGFPERATEIERWLRSGKAYVAVRDGKVCAYTALGRMFGRPFIEMLMVDEPSRGQGMGSRLVAHLEELAEGPELWTSTNLSNQRMQRLLAARGYSLTGYIDNLDPGDPELFFFKKL